MTIHATMPPRIKTSDKRKRSIYLPGGLLQKIEAEALRQDCTVSRLMQLAWMTAEPTMALQPTMHGLADRIAARREAERARSTPPKQSPDVK